MLPLSAIALTFSGTVLGCDPFQLLSLHKEQTLVGGTIWQGKALSLCTAMGPLHPSLSLLVQPVSEAALDFAEAKMKTLVPEKVIQEGVRGVLRALSLVLVRTATPLEIGKRRPVLITAGAVG